MIFLLINSSCMEVYRQKFWVKNKKRGEKVMILTGIT